MRLFSYVLVHDGGSAPNPFWNTCTLAICKPRIRKAANPGDWIVGIGPAHKPSRGKLIYAMRVDEVLPLDHYFHDPRFALKKPDDASDDPRLRVGDNVYFQKGGLWQKLPGGTHTLKNLPKDVSGENTLVSRHFYYFGKNPIPLPPRLEQIAQGGRGHRCWFPLTYIEMLSQWLSANFSTGINAGPADLPSINSCSPKSARPQTPAPKRKSSTGTC